MEIYTLHGTSGNSFTVEDVSLKLTYDMEPETTSDRVNRPSVAGNKAVQTGRDFPRREDKEILYGQRDSTKESSPEFSSDHGHLVSGLEFTATVSPPSSPESLHLLEGGPHCEPTLEGGMAPTHQEQAPSFVYFPAADTQNDNSPSHSPDGEIAKGKFEPGAMCSDVSQAVEILRTGNRLADVTIRKKMITWSCWNIADVIRGPHKDTTWWKGHSLPRRVKAEPNGFQEIVAEDKEFHQEMDEICRRIDKKDRELVLMLDHILQVARRNDYRCSIDPTEVSEDETLQPVPEVNPFSSAQKKPPRGNGDEEGEGLNRRGNIFSRMFRAIRLRIARRDRSTKT